MFLNKYIEVNNIAYSTVPWSTVVSLQGVSVTPDAFEAIALKYSDTINELCLIGALVHTPDAASYFQSLSELNRSWKYWKELL